MRTTNSNLQMFITALFRLTEKEFELTKVLFRPTWVEHHLIDLHHYETIGSNCILPLLGFFDIENKYTTKNKINRRHKEEDDVSKSNITSKPLKHV